MVPAFCEQVVAKLAVGSCMGEGNFKFYWILSEKSVLEYFTLLALKEFNKCTNTCDL